MDVLPWEMRRARRMQVSGCAIGKGTKRRGCALFVGAQRPVADGDMGCGRQKQRLRFDCHRLFGPRGRGRTNLDGRDGDLPCHRLCRRDLPRVRDSHAGEQAGQARQQRREEQQQTQAIRPDGLVSRRVARSQVGET